MTDPSTVRQQALDLASQGQDAVTRLVSALSEQWAAMLSPASQDGMPSPSEIIDRAFDLSIQMLEAQRAFAHSMVSAGLPMADAMRAAVPAPPVSSSVSAPAASSGRATPATSAPPASTSATTAPVQKVSATTAPVEKAPEKVSATTAPVEKAAEAPAKEAAAKVPAKGATANKAPAEKATAKAPAKTAPARKASGSTGRRTKKDG